MKNGREPPVRTGAGKTTDYGRRVRVGAVTARTASSATRRPLVAASAWLFGFAKYGTDRRLVRVLASEALGGRGAVREEGEPGR